MDPNACLRRLVDALDAGDDDAAAEAAHDLNDWMARGGFAPEWKGSGFTAQSFREYLAVLSDGEEG